MLCMISFYLGYWNFLLFMTSIKFSFCDSIHLILQLNQKKKIGAFQKRDQAEFTIIFPCYKRNISMNPLQGEAVSLNNSNIFGSRQFDFFQVFIKGGNSEIVSIECTFVILFLQRFRYILYLSSKCLPFLLLIYWRPKNKRKNKKGKFENRFNSGVNMFNSHIYHIYSPWLRVMILVAYWSFVGRHLQVSILLY